MQWWYGGFPYIAHPAELVTWLAGYLPGFSTLNLPTPALGVLFTWGGSTCAWPAVKRVKSVLRLHEAAPSRIIWNSSVSEICLFVLKSNHFLFRQENFWRTLGIFFSTRKNCWFELDYLKFFFFFFFPPCFFSPFCLVILPHYLIGRKVVDGT